MQDGGSQQLDSFELFNSGSVNWQIHHTRFGCEPSVNLPRHCDVHEFRKCHIQQVSPNDVPRFRQAAYSFWPVRNG